MKFFLIILLLIFFCNYSFAQRTFATCDCVPANNKMMVTASGNIVNEGEQTFKNGFKKYKYHPYLQFSNHTECTAEILYVQIANKILYPRLRIASNTKDIVGFEKEFSTTSPIIFTGSKKYKATSMKVVYRLNTKNCNQQVELLLNQDDTN